MRLLRSKKGWAVAGIIAGAAMVTAIAVSGVFQTTILADGTNIHFQVIRRSAVDFDSGWHMHPGLAIVQVQSGSLQITQGSCTPKTVNAGDTEIEVPYLPVRATATGAVTWTTTFLIHYEEPLMVPIATSPCP